MRNRAFGNQAAFMVVGVAMSFMAILLVARFRMATVSDHKVAEREQALVSNGMRGWVSEVEGRIEGQTTWDEAMLNLGVRYDPAWAHKNVAGFFHDMLGFERAYVLNSADQPIYAMNLANDQPPAAYGLVKPIAAPLVARVRQVEAARPAVPKKARYVMPPPDQASDFGLIDGRPSIVTATLIQSDFGKQRIGGPAPVVITTESLDADLLRKFSARFLLTDLRLAAISARGASPGHASIALTGADGRRVGRLEWTPQTPAHLLLFRTLPAVLAAMAAFCLIATALFMRGRKVVRALVASETQSKHMAYHDHLTGLPNRAMLSQRMSQVLADLRRGGPPIGVLALDLDRFKLINDTYGHGAGDELIVQVASRLNDLARSTDTVVRLGGDEFAILCTGATPNGLAILSERIVTALSAPIELPFGCIFTGVSVGVTLVDDQKIDGEEALRQADLAMYRAKDGGRGRFQFYEPEMDLALKSRRALEEDLREALRNGDLRLVYQPQMDGSGEVVGVEALARWTHPERGPVSPTFFVPIAEECGLIDALGEYTLRRAFTDSLRWPGLSVAVNVSARQLRNGDFAELANRVLRDTGADPKRIELEITEGVLLEDDQSTHETLHKLRTIGFSLALDDFGTGYSSLAYLRRYPVDKIKIDRSFVTTLGTEKESEAVVTAIVRLARALSLEVIAEGVETEAQRSGLRRAGCTEVQGFLYSHPIAADEIDAFIDLSAVKSKRRRVHA